LRERLVLYVAQELSRLPATDGKEKSHGNGSLPLREVRLEGLDAMGFNPRIEQFIQRRRKAIRDNLRHADLGHYPHYPKEKVREVLGFWRIKL
jgi:hypothetical protein